MANETSTSSPVQGGGISLGSLVALYISICVTHSTLGWTVVHALLGWAWVIYYFVTR